MNVSSSYSTSGGTSEEEELFVTRISPPRDLVCPITLNVFHDPVIALGDGQTYERSAILSWFQAQQNNTSTGAFMGIRSPVSNAYMIGEDMLRLIPNKVARDMAQLYRESLGKKLFDFIVETDELQNSYGSEEDFYIRRIRSMVEMGADLNITVENKSVLALLIEKKQLNIIRYLLSQDDSFSVSLFDCTKMVKNVIANSENDNTISNNLKEWKNLLLTLEERARTLMILKEQQASERNTGNNQLRGRQRLHIDEATRIAATNRTGTVINGTLIENGLGNLEDAMGYFPNLLALQFQSKVASAPSSFHSIENLELKRLCYAVKFCSGLLLLIWIFC